MCPVGQTNVGGICKTPAPTCTGGQVLSGNMCMCPTGQIYVNSICRTPATNPVCTGGQIPSGNTCVCPAGQTNVGGVCKSPIVTPTCTGGQILVGNICSCPTGQVLSSLSGMCQVPTPARACSSIRWDVKTGNDRNANAVSTTEFATAISLLQLQTPPSVVVDDGNRISPVENTRFLVEGTLISYKATSDSEYQLILKSSSSVTMIAAIPHPDCVGQNSPFYAEIKAARETFDKTFAAQTQASTTQTIIQVGGIGFWQAGTDANGQLQNKMELHPVTAIQFNPKQEITTFGGKYADYRVSATKIGYTIADNSGTPVLATNLQRIKFADMSLAFDLEGNAGKAYRLYQAAFNRTPDAAGLGYWIQAMDKGMTIQEVAASFMESAEFKVMYGASPNHTTLVTRFYANVLHRTPDQAGYDYWLGQLNSKLSTPATALASFSESQENKTQTAEAIKNGIAYIPQK